MALLSNFQPVGKSDWLQQVEKELKGEEFEKQLVWRSESGLRVDPLYGREDLEELQYLSQAKPGRPPFLRGKAPHHNHWAIRQELRSSEPERLRRQIGDAVEGGIEELALFSRRSLTGERDGCPIDSAQALAALLEGVPSDLPLHLSGSSYAIEQLAWITELSESRGGFRGSISCDPLGEVARSGCKGGSCEAQLDTIAGQIADPFWSEPDRRLLVARGALFHNAGADIVQELAIALAAGNDYIAQFKERGVAPERLLPLFTLQLTIGSSYFHELARLRAARLLWQQILSAWDPALASDRRYALTIDAVASQRNHSVCDIHVNFLRNITAAMSATLGGCDSLTLPAFDGLYSDGSDLSLRMSRNIQHILRHESFFGHVADPAAGSWYIENLTIDIAQAAWDLFTQIEGEGGFLATLRSGWLGCLLRSRREERLRRVQAGQLPLLGCNRFALVEEKIAERFAAAEMSQVGGSCGAIGEDEEDGLLIEERLAVAFERLRSDCETFGEQRGQPLTVLLLTAGDLTMRRARAGFGFNLFSVAGMRVVDHNGYESAAAAVAAAVSERADLILLCSSDAEYAALLHQTSEAAASHNLDLPIWIAGNPESSLRSELSGAGAVGFLHLKSHLLAELTTIARSLGVRI